MWLRLSPQSVAGYSTSLFCFPRRAPLVFADDLARERSAATREGEAANCCIWQRALPLCRRSRASLGRKRTHIRALHKEESMATQSFLDMIEEFGTGLGVPKVDVDKLIEVHRRNIDALGRSAQV